jgi:hypothetical protein
METKNLPSDYLDPAWDYLPIYRKLLLLQTETRNSINFVIDQDRATPQSHAELAMQLEKIANSLRVIQQELR